MRSTDFRRLLQMFSDPGSDFEYQGNSVLVQVDGNLIDVPIEVSNGEVWVTEGDSRIEASAWIVRNLAKVDILCERLLGKLRDPNPFIPPACDFSPSFEVAPSGESRQGVANDAFFDLLSNASSLETTIIYLTSDAGEGKTTLIHHLAVCAARKFKEGVGKALIVPISLGGRPFIGFDDLVVGTLLNQFRFGYYYYGAFLELVKMGLIIPALDGFEEMFILKGSGEASSALGALVQELDSQGVIVISARRAYFEYQNLSNQSRLLETLRNEIVGFARISLQRWGKHQFLDFLGGRGFNPSEALEIYESLVARVGVENALVSRPVFVEKLASLAENTASYAEFLRVLADDENDPFEPLIQGILHREAHSKWLYRTRDVSQPILTVEQHINLLGEIALEMWDSSVASLGSDVIEVVAEIFAEKERFSAAEVAQVKDRINGHALLVPSGVRNQFQFDHEEFMWFFLGEALAKLCLSEPTRGLGALRTALRRNHLPKESIRRLARVVGSRSEQNQRMVLGKLQKITLEEGRATFAQENAAQMVLELLGGLYLKEPVILVDFSFPEDALFDANFQNVVFNNCMFSSTRLGVANLKDCTFDGCQFMRLEIDEEMDVARVNLVNCEVLAIVDNVRKISIFDSDKTSSVLSRLGFAIPGVALEESEGSMESVEYDVGCKCVEKLIRIFEGSNHVSENIIKLRFGARTTYFLDECLPELLRRHVLHEIPYKGKGNQRLFVLGSTLERIGDALLRSEGQFAVFLDRMEDSSDSSRNDR